MKIFYRNHRKLFTSPHIRFTIICSLVVNEWATLDVLQKVLEAGAIAHDIVPLSHTFFTAPREDVTIRHNSDAASFSITTNDITGCNPDGSFVPGPTDNRRARDPACPASDFV